MGLPYQLLARAVVNAMYLILAILMGTVLKDMEIVDGVCAHTMLKNNFKWRLIMNLVIGLLWTAFMMLLWPLTPFFICDFIFCVMIYVTPVYQIFSSTMLIIGILALISKGEWNSNKRACYKEE